jgi:tetratricopeptide (TPR) repeat protein
MSPRTFRIRGSVSNVQRRQWSTTDQVSVRTVRQLTPGRARDGVTGELEVAADEVVRVELDNGFVLWSRADDIVRDYGHQSLARDGGDAWEFGALAPSREPTDATRDERGLLGLGIKVLEFFGIDLKAKAAHTLGAVLEEKLLKDHPPGMYRCSLADTFALTPLAEDQQIPAAGGPILLFLHGTASSCAGSFGKLWAPENREGKVARERFQARYGERVYAFEHRSLTESPLSNVLALVERLPPAAEVHLVSHSRGGLVGELLCLGSCEQLDTMLPAGRLDALFAADRTIAEQIGLSPLDEEAARERDQAYEDDRKRLTRLIESFKTRPIDVRRFVRVACPARGTTLASGRLDRWLSVLDFLAEKTAGDGLFADGVDFLLAVVKERTDPRTLPGLEAMMPGSALTRLLQQPQLVSRADLTVIAGDIEGESLWQKIKIVATDWFYSADHDLVVNTGSMSGGLRRPEKGARFRKDQGPDVNHFSYFANARSVRWLVAGLGRADGDEAGFLPIAAAQKEEPRWRDAIARSRAATAPRPLAVVLPGTMGSHLAAGGEQVWLNYWSLLRGGLKKLRMGQPAIEPTELVDDFYGPLLEFLARTHRVEFFAYDWRLSVRDAAAKLAAKLDEWLPAAERDGQPVHLVAHSMGGLVVRSMIADGGRGAAQWARITRLPNSRLLMLGTPNLGSYEAVRWLTGFNPTQAKLSLLDITQSTDQIVDLVRDYTGLLELLPFALKDPDFADLNRWKNIKETTRARWQTAAADNLGSAKRTWQLLRDAAPDPRHMRYVAGCQPVTVVDYQFADYDQPWLAGRKRLAFLATREGDGTVSWASGALPGVRTWYVEDTAHDALCARTQAFTAYLDLLNTGSTTRLPESPPARARTAAGEPTHFLLPSLPPADGVPGEADLASLGFGGGLPPAVSDQRPAAPTIEVSITHGDLSYARYAVLVGHYRGDTIVSAEAALDRQLDGALSRRLDLGVYPGSIGQHALFFNKRPSMKPGGAIVVGLGQVGELTPGLLESCVRTALLDYALQVVQWPDQRFGKAGSARCAAISCLLVGTGAGGMTVRDALESILRGAIAANQRLVDTQMDEQVTIDKIEFLEIYEDVAIAACEDLQAVLRDGQLASAVRWPGQTIERGQGAKRRVRFDEAPQWWHRLEIVEEKGRRDVLRFIFATDRARAEETLASGQLALAESFIRRASQSASANPEAARTLFEMLLPLRLKETAPRQTDLVLLVDETSARYPWELLENRWSDSGRPPAVGAGLLRQLKTRDFRARPAYAIGPKALVVGNPDIRQWEDKFSDLPGARREAQRVHELFSAGGYESRDCIDENAAAILESLHRDAWRILHLAGHGAHEFVLKEPSEQTCKACGQPPPARERLVSGMVIGKETFLTPGDVEQMRWVPELVFINCCHLGKTGSDGDLDRGALAANLGVQFIRMGVRAVVAAGWAVDDAAALTFAETFYGRMLQGEFFGEAVRAAREEAWQRHPGVNTWGAYQCYGDPNYRLRKDSPARSVSKRPYHAPSELVADLDNLASDFKAGQSQPEAESQAGDQIASLLQRIPQSRREAWLARADVAAALGFAWGEARQWTPAIEWLDKAIAAGKADCPLRALEQSANFKVRFAAEEWLALRNSAPADCEERRLERVGRIERAIAELEIVCQRGETGERLNLLGSAFKRLALVETQRDRRQKVVEKMAAYYRRAFELGNRDDFYAFTNWATARLLALCLDPRPAGEWQTDLEAEAARVSEALERASETDPDFWKAAGRADLDLVRLIARCAAASAPGESCGTVPAMPPECAALEQAIIECYVNAIKRGASPRERGSVIENLESLIELIGQSPSSLAEAIRRIREAL